MNDLRTAIFIAYKSIVRGRVSTFALMMLIICLSFFNMLFIPGVFSGLLNTIIGLEIRTYSAHVIVGPQQEPLPKQYMQNQAQVRAQIETIPGVVGTAREYTTAGSIAYDKDKNGVFKTVSAQVIGIDPTESQRVFSIKPYIVSGSFLSDDDTDQIVLSGALTGGYDLPEPNDLGGAKVGDKVQVVYGNGVARTYTIKGITKILFAPSLTTAYITTKEAQSVLSTADQASQIVVKVDDQDRADYYKARIQDMFPTLHLQTYLDLITAIKPVLDAFRVVAIIVSVVSVFIAAITIFVIIYINATSKRRQIGILKAIGITERIIVLSYVFQALFFVCCGVLVGNCFVFFIIKPILAVHPIMLPFGPMELRFSPNLVAESIAGFVVAGFLAGFVPSRIVAREKILSAIWG